MNIFNVNVLLARHSNRMWLEQASNDLLTFTQLPIELISIMWDEMFDVNSSFEKGAQK